MIRGSIIARLIGGGFTAVLLALLLWPVAARWDGALWPFLALLAVAALTGTAVLLLTGADLLLHPRRGERVGPIRIFDIVSGGALLGFALLQLHWLGGWLPA
ncbi:MAG: hypothetical protein JOZ90_02855 [Alphaproteobacteria bacterium]|nr:hypothetical protein [Alphaproteobacteria bacterium]MBV9370473.1 hypothetical protein [Alphaproteobacteria bacterium]MBV9900017.1 hypothetical protein [Alphaproteobacteria bacterium]